MFLLSHTFCPVGSHRAISMENKIPDTYFFTSQLGQATRTVIINQIILLILRAVRYLKLCSVLLCMPAVQMDIFLSKWPASVIKNNNYITNNYITNLLLFFHTTLTSSKYYPAVFILLSLVVEPELGLNGLQNLANT